MAFLSHTIPWHSLSSMFEYKDASNPGPQHPDLFAKSKPDQRKQAEHFARTFHSTLREHSGVERRKYRPVEDFVERARTWTASGRDSSEAVSTEVSSKNGEEEPNSAKRRNAELRTSPEGSWPTASPERRYVYPPDFSTTYMSHVPITSGADYGRTGIVDDFAHVEMWIDFAARKARSTHSEEERNRLWLDRKSCSDILRIMTIDAATAETPERCKTMLETSLLLAHHPRVGIGEFVSDGMACCNVGVGLTSFIERIAVPFIYLNLLWTLIDDNLSSPLLRKRDNIEQYQGSYYRNSKFATLFPRPAYMNTKSFNNMLTMVLQEHGHVVEHVFFNPLFAPYPSGKRSKYLKTDQEGRDLSKEEMRTERDVFTDLPALREALKAMWKMLVYCDVLFRDIEQPVNWEYVVINSISILFQDKGVFERLMGLGWVDYELDREEHGGFSFFATRHGNN